MIKIILIAASADEKGFYFKELVEGLNVEVFIRPVHLRDIEDATLENLVSRMGNEGINGVLTYGTEVRAYCQESFTFYKTALTEGLKLLTAQEKTVFMPVNNWINRTYHEQHVRLEKEIVADIINAVKFLNGDIGFSGNHADIELHLGILDKGLLMNRELNDFVDGRQ